MEEASSQMFHFEPLVGGCSAILEEAVKVGLTNVFLFIYILLYLYYFHQYNWQLIKNFVQGTTRKTGAEKLLETLDFIRKKETVFLNVCFVN